MGWYATAYQRVLWPTYEALRGRHTYRLWREALRRQWWSPAQLQAWQQRELERLWQHARQHCPWYREQPAGVLTKDIIRAHREQLLADNYRGRVFVHRTGGSTGAPLTFYMTRESYEWRNAVTQRGYGWAGAADGVRVFYLWALAALPAGVGQRWKTVVHDAVLRHRIFNSFPLTPVRLAECVTQANRFAPVVLAGYTSLLEALARYVQKHGGWRVRLRSVITAAEGVSPAQRELFQEVFGAPVFASYGSREFKLIAMECERGVMHVNADNLRVEVIRDGQPAGPGQWGTILITDLHNYGMPFIRYEIGDVAAAATRDCDCGRGLPVLGEIQGRLTDVLQLADGRLVSGLFFPHLLKEFDWIEQYQVVQTDRDRVVVKCVATTPPEEPSLARLRGAILAVLGPSVRLEIELVREIARTASGKHRSVISEVPLRL
jgi:phenylacetate-CoA ligase